MHRTKLWHASSGRKFPLNPRQQGLFQLEVAEIDLKQLAALEDTDAALTELKDKLEEARANLQHQGDSDRRKHTDRRQANDRRQGQGRRDSDRT